MNSTAQIVLRPAAEADLSFLVDAVVEAEKSGTDRLSYCTVFGLSEAEFRQILGEMLLEDIEGQELALGGFLLAEAAGRPAGTCSAWVEKAGGVPSPFLRAQLLMHYFGSDRVRASQRNVRVIRGVDIERDPGAIQIESVFVDEGFRGCGIAPLVIREQVRRLRDRYPASRKAQVLLSEGNGSARKAYEKLGFAVVAARESADPELLALLPAGKRLLMEWQLN